MRQALYFVATLLASAALGDDVLLINGATYEGVIAQVEGSSVRIQLSTGSLTLPRSRVARIDRAESVLAAFEQQRARLDADFDTAAEPWLALASWARHHRYPSGERSAALRAAAIDPSLPDLVAVLARHDFVLDDALQRYVRRAAARREPAAQTALPTRDQRQPAGLEQQRQQLAEERRAIAEAADHQATSQRQGNDRPITVSLSVVPLLVVPWVVVPTAALPPASEARPYRGYLRLVGHQPGSFIPLDG